MKIKSAITKYCLQHVKCAIPTQTQQCKKKKSSLLHTALYYTIIWLIKKECVHSDVVKKKKQQHTACSSFAEAELFNDIIIGTE
jgi:hypothetical protein